ncbi:hypothetical protein [Cohnella herbarum]|uniref:Uncharacterized protein n=1 Tax=Cohnella herbarum TaxID=2728023 RepID=A0A7Z2VT94_9BACL|nr:hypothetical protein [Cohnella herbarum]QJD83287.1 hypothetical protein HH215_08960 [Cohnella herbarum]QJD88622.1 hypothetical protein HH215_35900 [Cohnella herbarum]
MKIEMMSNLPPTGESVAKLASEGNQLIIDISSISGFFAFCLVFVGLCLIVPVIIYEKYYKIADDEPASEINQENREATDQAA